MSNKRLAAVYNQVLLLPKSSVIENEMIPSLWSWTYESAGLDLQKYCAHLLWVETAEVPEMTVGSLMDIFV